jgi:hypothetical protein
MNNAKKSGSGVMKEVYTISELLYEQYMSTNFDFSFQILDANKDKTFEVVENFGFKKHVFDFDLSTRAYYCIAEVNGGNVMLIIDVRDYKGDCDVAIFSDTLDALEVVHKSLFDLAVKNFLSKDDVVISYSDFSIANNSLSESVTRMKLSTFKTVSDKYYPFIDMHVFINEFLTRQESILVLIGESGTGKTKFSSLILKMALQNYNLIEDMVKANLNNDLDDDLDDDDDFVEPVKQIRVGYLKNEDILATDQFWNMIKTKKFDFIILDDLDYMLLPRTRDLGAGSLVDINRSKFISQLLSFTDGIVPTSTKFIITSNRSDKDIDSALMRPGRMFGILSFRELTYEEALAIWIDEKLESKSDLFYSTFPDNSKNITHAELGSIIYQAKLKGGRASYLKEGETEINITSKSQKAAKKKLGFEIEKKGE